MNCTGERRNAVARGIETRSDTTCEQSFNRDSLFLWIDWKRGVGVAIVGCAIVAAGCDKEEGPQRAGALLTPHVTLASSFLYTCYLFVVTAIGWFILTSVPCFLFADAQSSTLQRRC